jgi:hypothetical protein
MKLEQLHNKHAGETVWVIGSGSSLGFIHPEFFDNKTTVAVNLSGRIHGFKPNYLFSHYHEVVARNLDDDSIGVSLQRDTLTNKPWVNAPNNVCFFPNFSDEPAGEAWDPYERQPLPNSLVYGSSSLHGAMHLAAHMGARFVILVGADCGTIDGEHRIAEYPQGDTPWNIYEQHNRRMKQWLQEHYACHVYSLNPFINFNLEGHNFEGAQ